MIVTAFKNIHETKNPNYISITAALDRIKNGKSKANIEKIRKLVEKGERNKYKKSLPSICFSGKFSEREDSKIQQHSGLVILDWDDLEDVDEVKKVVASDEYTYAVWVSPSGNGVKALVRIPPEPLNHEKYYAGLMAKYPELDASNSNISRACYESYDPNIIINENSKVWEKVIDIKKEIQIVEKPFIHTSSKYIDAVVQNAWDTASEMVKHSAEGERHAQLIKASKLLGGYFNYGVEESTAVSVLGQITTNRGSDKGYNHIKTIRDGFRYGQNQPIYIDVNKSNKAPVMSANKRTINKSTTLSTRESESAWLKMVYANKMPQGLAIGSEEFDQHYRLKEKTLVGIFGIDNVGKTTFYIFLSVCYAKRYGKKFLLLTRENDCASVRQKIIELYLGKFAHQATTSERQEAEDFSYEFYEIVTLNSDINYNNFSDRIRLIYKTKHFDACFIDPYNAIQYEQVPKKNYEFLSNLRNLQNELNTSFHISMHISTDKARNYVYGSKEFITDFQGSMIMLDGQIKVPKKSFVEGGQPIANKLDDIMIVHRIQKVEELRSYTLVSIDKVKETQTGGMVTFEQPIMFKKEYGFISFKDKEGINPLDIEKPFKNKKQELPRTNLVDAFESDSLDEEVLF